MKHTSTSITTCVVAALILLSAGMYMLGRMTTLPALQYEQTCAQAETNAGSHQPKARRWGQPGQHHIAIAICEIPDPRDLKDTCLLLSFRNVQQWPRYVDLGLNLNGKPHLNDVLTIDITDSQGQTRALPFGGDAFWGTFNRFTIWLPAGASYELPVPLNETFPAATDGVTNTFFLQAHYAGTVSAESAEGKSTVFRESVSSDRLAIRRPWKTFDKIRAIAEWETR